MRFPTDFTALGERGREVAFKLFDYFVRIEARSVALESTTTCRPGRELIKEHLYNRELAGTRLAALVGKFQVAGIDFGRPQSTATGTNRSGGVERYSRRPVAERGD